MSLEFRDYPGRDVIFHFTAGFRDVSTPRSVYWDVNAGGRDNESVTSFIDGMDITIIRPRRSPDPAIRADSSCGRLCEESGYMNPQRHSDVRCASDIAPTPA